MENTNAETNPDLTAVAATPTDTAVAPVKSITTAKEDKLQDLRDRVKELEELLKECIPGLCSHLATRNRCPECSDKLMCVPRKLIPKVRHALGIVFKE